MPPTPTTVSRWEFSRANCSMAGASSRHVSQKGDQNQNRSGFSPFTTDRRLTNAPVAASNMSTSGTSSEISKAMDASVVVGAGGSVVAVVVSAWVVLVVVGVVLVAVVSSVGVVSATVVSVVGWMVPAVVVALPVTAVFETAGVVVVSGAVVDGAFPAVSSAWMVGWVLSVASAVVVAVPVGVGSPVSTGSVTVVTAVVGGSTDVVAVPLPHAAIARVVATEAMNKPGDGRIRDRLGEWPGTRYPTTRPTPAVARSASPPCRAMSKRLTLQRTKRTPLSPTFSLLPAKHRACRHFRNGLSRWSWNQSKPGRKP